MTVNLGVTSRKTYFYNPSPMPVKNDCQGMVGSKKSLHQPETIFEASKIEGPGNHRNENIIKLLKPSVWGLP